MLNLTEICVANGTGIFLISFLIFVRRKKVNKASISDRLFSLMLAISLAALIGELGAFVLDGRAGTWHHILLRITNFITLIGSPAVAYLFSLYVEFRMHRNVKRLRKRITVFSIPFFVDLIICLADCFFNLGLVYLINENNEYERGLLIPLALSIILFYFASSVINYFLINSKASERQFFPVISFLLPCFLGMAIQALFYGIAVGWLGVSIAFVFMYIQLQTESGYVDSLSGLFNRRYMEQYVSGFMPRDKSVSLYGVMIDVNGFKKINDTWGHTMGDDAIVSLGKILSETAGEKDVVTRFAGDEFILLTKCSDEISVHRLLSRINGEIEAYNRTTQKPYKFSLSMGYGKYRPGEESVDEFLKDIDDAMYKVKEAFYRQSNNERRARR